MAIAQVIGRLQQLQGRPGTDPEQRFRRRDHLHHRPAAGPAQPLTGLQRFAPIQLQEQFLATDSAPLAPQAAAFIGRKGQRQRRRLRLRQRLGAAARQDQGQGRRFRHRADSRKQDPPKCALLRGLL